VGPLGPLAVTAGLFILSALAAQVMPNPAVAVLLAPTAINTANDLGISPCQLMMAVAVSASAAFLNPVGHSASVLVMGPGGYRFADYTKVGIPLTWWCSRLCSLCCQSSGPSKSRWGTLE
jgi:di/tricarboxylate transporter